jgi:ABC-type nitrate/sulfonate/bicarbonate transport system permease component
VTTALELQQHIDELLDSIAQSRRRMYWYGVALGFLLGLGIGIFVGQLI